MPRTVLLFCSAAQLLNTYEEDLLRKTFGRSVVIQGTRPQSEREHVFNCTNCAKGTVVYISEEVLFRIAMLESILPQHSLVLPHYVPVLNSDPLQISAVESLFPLVLSSTQ